MRFAGKVAIITGAGAGIGQVYAHRLASEGAAIVIADIDATAANAVANEINETGARAIATITDVADEAQLERMVAAAVDAFGGVDFLVNNAGMHLTEYSRPPTQLERRKWRLMLDVNVTAPMIASALCRPIMAARGGGCIVNQSSMAAYSASGAYGVSKMALNTLTVALATEFAPDGIRVNGIAPGLVDSAAAIADLSDELKERVLGTQLIKRLGRMTDLANMLAFLLSDEASFITAQTFLVDGGSTKRL